MCGVLMIWCMCADDCDCYVCVVWVVHAVPEKYHKYVDGVITFLLEAVRSQITADQLRFVTTTHKDGESLT